MRKILVVNGCLRMEQSATEKILTPFYEGMRQAGGTVEMFYLKRMKIHPCEGDFICWAQTPGVCPLQDDMQILYQKMREADILVFATPVYIPLPGQMQDVLNRMVALIDPLVRTRNCRTRGVFRKEFTIKKLALVSSCGWWELGNFETVERIVRELAEDGSVNYAGAVLRPHIQWLGKNPEKAKEIFQASRDAGFQLVKKGTMSEETLHVVSQPLVSNARFLEMERNAYR
ncbi:MAG: flavodoxin family protein [Candidatus Thermoplasmatota archaeon]|nr:flavodoxin family protein [Candidatus Thermoplasmatota archaeon]